MVSISVLMTDEFIVCGKVRDVINNVITFSKHHNFYHPFLQAEKIERKSRRISQTKSASFHENTIVRVPIVAIPRAEKSWQISQTSPEVNRNENARDKIRIRIIFFIFPFLWCIYYNKNNLICQVVFPKKIDRLLTCGPGHFVDFLTSYWNKLGKE